MEAMQQAQIEEHVDREFLKEFYGEKKIRKLTKPIECPICYMKVRIFANDKGEIATEVVRGSSLNHCPRCKSGRMDG